MIKKSFLFVLLSVLLTAVGFQAVAQEPGQYEGTYRFSYPADLELTEGNDFIQLTSDTNTTNIYGPTNYTTVIGGQTFDDNVDALEFFVDRAGLEVGDQAAGDLSDNQLAAVNVTLPQRKQSGMAVLMDLQNGRKAVVVFLANEDEEIDTAAMNEILGSLEYPADLIDVASSNPDFSMLVAAVQAAGLADTLRSGEYTIFAPTNEAFEKALKQLGMTAEEAMANTEALTSILQYHVVEGVWTSDLITSGWVTTLSGDQIDIQLSRGKVRINGVASVVTPDVTAANGVIHVIDRVLLPPDLEAARLSKQFTATLKRFTSYEGNFTFKYPTGAEVTEGPGNVIVKSGRAAVTVYGPEAYSNLVGDNVIEGDAERLAFFLDRLNAIEVGDAIDPLPETAKAGVNVTIPRFNQAGQAYLVDLQNGRTGVVVALAQRDGYSLAYSGFAADQALATLAYPADIVDVAAGNEDLSLLVSAIEAAGLTDTLRDKSASYTVFAPTNQAFMDFLAQSEMSAEEALGNPELLTDILTYHVISGGMLAADLTTGEVETVNTYPVSIGAIDDGIMVNDAKVVQADIEAANGVIHVIDKVLVPPLCFAVTESETAAVRVGPAEDRAIATYLAVGPKIPVTGQYVDASDVTWYMLNAEAAAPGKQMREAWVSSADLTVTGSGCATLPVSEMN